MSRDSTLRDKQGSLNAISTHEGLPDQGRGEISPPDADDYESWRREVEPTINALASRLLVEAHDVQVGQDLKDLATGLQTREKGIVECPSCRIRTLDEWGQCSCGLYNPNALCGEGSVLNYETPAGFRGYQAILWGDDSYHDDHENRQP